MDIGFTGTQHGMSKFQEDSLTSLLAVLDPNTFHHGDCIGADKEAHFIAGILGIEVVIHPPLNPKKRAFCRADTILEEKEYLERNRDIVDSTNILIAAPGGPETLRSGTWSTIRYAKNKKKKLYILWPDKETEEKNGV